MWFIGIGTVLLLLKWFAVDPVAHWAWWIVLLPFLAAFVWFEIIEPFFGLDKKDAHNQLDKIREERYRKQLEQRPRR